MDKAQEWIDTLDQHKKGKGVLAEHGRYCCLGVLAEMEGILQFDEDGNGFVDGDDHKSYVIIPESRKFGISFLEMGQLMDVNDESDTWEPVKDKIRELYGK